jgi:hypothetical protein
MDSSDRDISRRTILRGMAASAVLAITGAAKAQQVSESLKPPADVSASSLIILSFSNSEILLR